MHNLLLNLLGIFLSISKRTIRNIVGQSEVTLLGQHCKWRKHIPPNVGIYQSMWRRNTKTSVSNQLSDVPATLVIGRSSTPERWAGMANTVSRSPASPLLTAQCCFTGEGAHCYSHYSHYSPGVHESMNELYVADDI